MRGSALSFRSVCDRILDGQRPRPESGAIVSGELRTSYGELEQRSQGIADFLLRSGIARGATVAVCMDRSVEWILVALGILRAGAAYVPLDPTWPLARLRYAVEDSGAAAVFARAELLDRLQVSVLGIDVVRDAARMPAAASGRPEAIRPEDLAYVIYTSGSTGKPKGVEITHANLTHLIEWHREAFSLTSADRTSHLAGLGFDAAVWEIWPTLAVGGTLCIPEDRVRLSPDALQEWMLSMQITVGFVPTLHAAHLMQAEWPADTALRTLLTGGDTLHQSPRESLPFVVVNNYGPTECTVVATSGVLVPGVAGRPVIGREISGTSVYLLDANGCPVLEGEVGEIYIGGEGVGRGYRNALEETPSRFLADPFSRAPGSRMYRSGDRGLRRANGDLEFHGRVDRQVKIRGQRIELDEVSSWLNRYPGVLFATVLASRDEGGDAELAGYVLLRSGANPTTANLQVYLSEHLPMHMVPRTFLELRELPISPNGKIDLALLPGLVDAPLATTEDVKTVGSSVQGRLLAAVRELLNDATIGARDNFFLAGGHSLLGVQLIMRIRKAFKVDVTVRELFQVPTVQDLSELVERKLIRSRLGRIWNELLGTDHCAPEANFIALGGSEVLLGQLQMEIASEFGRYVTRAELAHHPTLGAQTDLLYSVLKSEVVLPAGVFAVQSEGASNRVLWLHYPNAKLAEAMGEERPFLYLTLTDDDFETLGDTLSVQQIARCLLPRILASQPEGPYLLGGFCLGGLLAYEVACQLLSAGHQVSLLILLDVPSPEYYKPADLLTLVRRPEYLKKRVIQLGIRRSLASVLQRASKRIQIRGERALVSRQNEATQELIENAAFRYKPSIFRGRTALIMASERQPDSPPHEHFLTWWRSLVPGGDLHEHTVHGLHLDLVEGPAVHQVAEIIAGHIAQTEQRRTGA